MRRGRWLQLVLRRIVHSIRNSGPDRDMCVLHAWNFRHVMKRNPWTRDAEVRALESVLVV